jgi:hypothetical protein
MSKTRKVDKDPFSNGTEFMIWEERNCDRCWKSSHLKSEEIKDGKAEYTKVICAIQRDMFTRMYSREPISQRTIDICRTFTCPYRHETRKRKRYEKDKELPKLFEL